MGRWQWMSSGLLMLALVVMSACGSDSSTTTVVGTPTVTATATALPPQGSYVFVRNGDLWVRQGDGTALASATLNLDPLVTTWGPLVWSPDDLHVAFVLRAPPLAPGDVGATPEQATGSLYILTVATHSLQQIQNGNGPVTVPLLGRHLAWASPNTLLVTQSGNVYSVGLAALPTVTIVSGLRSVWEIAERGTTLYYTTVPSPSATGAGVSQLRQRVGGNPDAPQSDTLVATLGPVTLPALACGGYLCPADLTTPFVPYAWDVSADGGQVVYESAAATASPSLTPAPTEPISTPTAAPAETATPSLTPNPSTTPVPSATPSAAATPGTMPDTASAPYYLVSRSSANTLGTPQLLSHLTSHPVLPVLHLAPQGQMVVLTGDPAGQTAGASLPPEVLALPAGTASQALRLPPDVENPIVGAVSWSPDGHSLAVVVRSAGTTTTGNVYIYQLSGEATLPNILEGEVQAFAWTTP